MRILLLACLVLLMALPSQAQSRKELAAKDAILEQRLSELENRFLTGDPAAERLMRRMDALETEQRALRGEVEQLRYERDALRGDVEKLAEKVARWEAIEARVVQHLEAVDLAAANAGSSAPNSGNQQDYLPPIGTDISPQSTPDLGPVPNAAPGTLGSEQVDMSELLTIGQNKLLSGDFAGAELAYQQYVNLNPNADDIDEAHYWLGETYIIRGRFPEASTSFSASLEKNPRGEFAPNALIGLASAMRNMGNRDGACQALSVLPSEYPNADADIRAKADTEKSRAGC